MKISRSEVEHVARLARLTLNQNELDQLTGEMDAILQYVETLNELDTDGIVPTAHAVPMENSFRDDTVKPSMDRDLILKNAPEKGIDGTFRVPRVIE